MADPTKVIKGGLSAVRNASRAADQALEAKRLALEAANPPIKASEAYGQHEGAYMKPIFYDRMKVDLSKGKKGGPGFSGIQLVDPNYANAKAAAGVTDQKMATRILNRNKAGVPAGAKVIWTPSVGGLEQHKSNSTMFGEFADIFANQRKNMSNEEIQKLSDRASKAVNNKGELIFPNGIDLGSRNFRQKVTTYDQRGLMADIFAGRGVGGEKGRTVPMEDLLEKNLDPNVAGAGTLDLGNRLFRLEGNVIDRPDLHSDYRKILTGEDLNVNYIPVPIRDVYSDWEAQKKLELAAQGKNRGVTLMDYTKNDPTVQLTEALLTKMQKAGQKKGGVVRSKESPQDMARFQKRYAMHKAIGGRVQSKPVKMAAGGSIFDKPVHMVDGGKVAKGLMGAINKASTAADAAMAEANLKKMLEPSKVQQRLYHGTTATEGGKGKEAIRRLKPSKEGALGSGVYMTPNTPHASSYTGIPNDEALAMMSQGNDYTKKMADQFMADRAAGRLREGQAGGNMLPVYAQIKNPLIIGKSGRNIDPAADALMGLGMDEASAIRLVEKAFEEKGNIGKQIQSRAQAQGYDGIMQYRGDELSEVVSYNPNAIKSAIGNQGTYDINHPDLSKARGGGVHMVDGGKMAKGMMSIFDKASKAADATLASKALPAAERDANLAKMLEKSKVKNKAYHATDQDVKRFDPKADKRTENKSNIAGWMTNDPEFANDFASQKFRYWKTRERPWEQDPNVPEGANIMPVHLSIENPFYATDLIKNLSGELNMDEAKAVAKALGVGVDELLGDIPKAIKYKSTGYEREHTPRGFDLVKSNVATDAMKRLGHDGVIAIENGSEVYAPFKETQIKSATGNRGTYDLNDPDINKAKGGRVEESPEDMARFQKRFVMHKALGGAVKKPQKFDGGGIASPEENLTVPPDRETKAGLMAEYLAKAAKEQGKEELSSLKKPRALTDLLNRGVLANNPLSAGVDLFNMGLNVVGAGSEKPFLGSEHMKELMNKTGVTSGEERPMMETALSFASPTAMIKGAMKATDAAKKAPELLNKASSAISSSKLSPLATEAKTASAGKPTGATYATKQEGPFFRVSPTTLDTSKAKTRGIREADELQSPAPLGGGAGSIGRETPQLLSSEEVGRIIADPVANEPLNIAKKYTQETQGTDFVFPDIPESSLVKQSAIGRTQQLAVDGSPEYKTAVFDAYAQQMPEVLEKAGAKNYDDLMEKAYRQLAKETDDQFKALPYNFSYHRAGEGNYNGAMDMASDVHGNKHLYVYQGGDKHDFLNRVDPASGLNENEKFRAVHDLLGHAIYGNQFGPKGEEMAWAIHSQMYSPLARLAMTAETRGQNSMVNYSPLNANLKAELAMYDSMANEARRKGDKALLNEIIAAKRQAYSGFEFAPNKAVLLPPEFLSPKYTGGMPSYLEAANRPVKGTETQSVLTHFSNDPNLQMLDPKRYGTGIKGAEAERLRDYAGGVKDRSYFYLGEPGTVAPEAGLGVNRYRGEASSLYDITQDPLNFQKLARESNRVPFTAKYNQGVTYPLQDANDVERLVKEYGYQGMANPKATKPMAIMFKETPVRRQARGGLTLMK